MERCQRCPQLASCFRVRPSWVQRLHKVIGKGTNPASASASGSGVGVRRRGHRRRGQVLSFALDYHLRGTIQDLIII
jgi:hypothetical protein